MTYRRIMEMMNISSKRVENTIIAINEEIEKGWQPYGDFFKDEDGWYCLIMVKYEVY